MQRVRIKICGLREPDKAQAIAKCGADAIGLVFVKESPRWVSPELAAEVAAALPPLVSTVGVFVNAPAETMNRVAERAKLHYLQLHGEEPPEMVADLARPVIKAFRVRDERWLEEVGRWLSGLADPAAVGAILLDAYRPDAHGGTGQRFNWQWVAAAREAGALKQLPPMILSGGLDVTNVVTAIEAVQPWAVDVSSGVESAPGVKDVKKASSLIAAVTDDVPRLRGDFWR